ncbi:MAG: glycosyltransferase family 39 protein [candidate division NC10 bacterium]|nr:glycosyltransferase family 39 protein [candidate division NC10 bacterium]
MAFVIWVGLLVFFTKLSQGLLVGDPANYAAIAKQVAQGGSWFDLHWGEHPYFLKPPLMFWLMALSFQVFGINAFAARLPSALFGFFSVILLYFFGRRLYGPWGGFLAAVVLATTSFFVKTATTARLESAVLFFTVAAIATVLVSRRKPWLLPLFWIFLGLEAMTKGPLFVFPLLIVAVHSLIIRDAHPWNSRAFWFSSPLFLLIVLPWPLYEYGRYGETFLKTYFGQEILSRVDPAPGLYRFLTYPKILLTSYWPWLPFAIYGLFLLARDALRKGDITDRTVLPLSWVLAIWVVLHVVTPQYDRYIIPLFPALAFASGRALEPLTARIPKAPLLKILSLVLLLASGVLWFLPLRLHRDVVETKDIVTFSPVMAEQTLPGEKVFGYRVDDWLLRGILLFYADRDISILAREEILAKRSGRGVLIITTEEGYQELQGAVRALIRGEKYLLVQRL